MHCRAMEGMTAAKFDLVVFIQNGPLGRHCRKFTERPKKEKDDTNPVVIENVYRELMVKRHEATDENIT